VADDGSGEPGVDMSKFAGAKIGHEFGFPEEEAGWVWPAPAAPEEEVDWFWFATDCPG
jgi:hypothetical protein